MASEELVRCSRWRFDAERDLVGDADAVALEGYDFFRVICQDANILQAEVDQDLRADAALVLDHALAGWLAVELAAFVNMNLGQHASCFGRIDTESTAGVMEIEENAAVLLSDGRERLGNKLVAIAGGRAEDIARQTMRVHANERRRFAFEAAANESDVLIVIDVAGVGNHAEVAEARGKNCFRDAADVTLVLHAIADKVRDRQHFQIVLPAKFVKLRHAGHGAVFVHDFADHAGGVKAGDAGEINAGFGLASAHEDAAVAGTKGEDVAGASEVLRASFFINGGEDGDGAVRGADAGGDAEAAVDGFAEGGAVNGGIDRRHQWEMEILAALFGQRETDKAAAKLGHEVDSFRGDFLGGHGEVAFVFAVFVVHHHQHAAGADLVQGFRN